MVLSLEFENKGVPEPNVGQQLVKKTQVQTSWQYVMCAQPQSRFKQGPVEVRAVKASSVLCHRSTPLSQHSLITPPSSRQQLITQSLHGHSMASLAPAHITAEVRQEQTRLVQHGAGGEAFCTSCTRVDKTGHCGCVKVSNNLNAIFRFIAGSIHKDILSAFESTA